MDAFLTNAYDVVVQPVIFLIFGVAFVVFVWGLVVFIKDKDSQEGRDTGKRTIIWGIVGMVIMVSAFGIINIIAGTLGVDITVDPTKAQQGLENIQVESDL